MHHLSTICETFPISVNGGNLSVPELIKKRKVRRNTDAGHARNCTCSYERWTVPQWLNFSALLRENNAETFNKHRAQNVVSGRKISLHWKMDGKKKERKKKSAYAYSSVFGVYACGIEQMRKSIVVPLRIQTIDYLIRLVGSWGGMRNSN